jgi:hypothetical protein
MMQQLFKILVLVILSLYLSGCCVHVTIQYKSNQGINNKLGQKTDANATLPIVGEEKDK